MAELKYVTWDGLVYYDGKVKQYIDDKFDAKFDSCLKFGGTCSFVDLPSPSVDTLNFLYKINDAFTVTPDNLWFVEQARNCTFAGETIVQVVEFDNTYVFSIFLEAITSTPVTPDGDIDLTSYYTKAEVDNLINLITRELTTKLDDEDLVGYATEEFVSAAVSNIKIDTSEFVTQDEFNTLKESIPSVEGFATETYVDDALNDLELESYAKTTDVDIIESAVEEVKELTNQLDSKVVVLETSVEDIESTVKALDGSVDSLIDDVTDLTSRLETKANTSDIPSLDGYATEEFVRSSVDSIPEVDLTPYALKSDVEGLATNNYVDTSIANISVPTKVSELENDKDYLSVIPDEYVTDEELSSKGYLTEHIDISGKADKQHSHTLSEISDYNPPDLSNLVTVEQLANSLDDKADMVPFTSSMFVRTPVGDFVKEENIQDMTLVEILTKLLGLSATAALTVVETIMKEDIPCYTISSEGSLEECTYNEIHMTEEEADLAPQKESLFYQVADSDGKIIESGYQIAAQAFDDYWLTISLPECVTSFTTKVWETGSSRWADVNFKFIKAIKVEEAVVGNGFVKWTHTTEDVTMEWTVPEGYCVWVVDPQYEVMSNSNDVYRLVIND